MPDRKQQGSEDRGKVGAASESNRDPGGSGLEVTVTDGGQQKRPPLEAAAV